MELWVWLCSATLPIAGFANRSLTAIIRHARNAVPRMKMGVWLTIRRTWHALLFGMLCVFCSWLVVRHLHLSTDVGNLLPHQGKADALRSYTRHFQGGDPGLVLLEGSSRTEVEDASRVLLKWAKSSSRIEQAYTTLALPKKMQPSSLFLLANDAEQHALREQLLPQAMHRRLKETRALLLAPGSGAISEQIQQDPLRLAQFFFSQRETSSQARSDGQLATEDGLARLVVLVPKGNAMSSQDAQGFVGELNSELQKLHGSYPHVESHMTGGHAIAAATETMLRTDLQRSSVLSMFLVSLSFLLFFRRPRALFAVLPPVLAGTLFTAAGATVFTGGLSAIAVAFASVVVGVGMDSGVHVYQAVVDALEQQDPLPRQTARLRTARPVLGAACIAASAFGCLALSEIEALKQFGMLAAAGEVLTALAIVYVTPEIAWLLERSRTHSPPSQSPAWSRRLTSLAARPLSGMITLGLLAILLVAVGMGVVPKKGNAWVAIRPDRLPPFQVYERIAQRFGSPRQAPWVLLAKGKEREQVRERLAKVCDELATRKDLVTALDTLEQIAPGPTTIARRSQLRAKVLTPSWIASFRQALIDTGFQASAFEQAIADWQQPSQEVPTNALGELLAAKYLQQGSGEWLAIAYVQVPQGKEQALEHWLASKDSELALTGFPSMEPALERALRHDLPKVGLAAMILFLVSLALALRDVRRATIAFLVIAAEIALVLVLTRLAGIPLHIYDALVLPVLLGITVDEVLFVLQSLRDTNLEQETMARALTLEAKLVATTAFTTAAGFGALMICSFDPLRHLGAVGALGSLVGLLLALWFVPTLLWLFQRKPSQPAKEPLP
jgi:uncharacterized protein